MEGDNRLPGRGLEPSRDPKSSLDYTVPVLLRIERGDWCHGPCLLRRGLFFFLGFNFDLQATPSSAQVYSDSARGLE